MNGSIPEFPFLMATLFRRTANELGLKAVYKSECRVFYVQKHSSEFYDGIFFNERLVFSETE